MENWKKWPDEQPARLKRFREDGSLGGEMTENVLVVARHVEIGDVIMIVASYDYDTRSWWSVEWEEDATESGREMGLHTVLYWMPLPAFPDDVLQFE